MSRQVDLSKVKTTNTTAEKDKKLAGEWNNLVLLVIMNFKIL